MTAQLWSWLLAAIGVTGIALAGRARPAIGWTIGLTAQLLWVAYAVATRQWGFLASAGAYGAVYAGNLRRSLRARADADQAHTTRRRAAMTARLEAETRAAATRLHADGHAVHADGIYLRPDAP